ncbi:MAG: carboxyltransferase domain-containing protein, partial [Planctomycetota bacterium]
MTPAIRTAGFDGFIVTFGDTLTEPANRAALAFRAALEDSEVEGIEETSTSLVSAYLRFDPVTVPHAEMQATLETLL